MKKVKGAGTGTQGTASTLGALPETQGMLQKLAAMCPSPGSARTSSSSSGGSKKMTPSVAEATRLVVKAWKAYQSPDSFENELDPRVAARKLPSCFEAS